MRGSLHTTTVLLTGICPSGREAEDSLARLDYHKLTIIQGEGQPNRVETHAGIHERSRRMSRLTIKGNGRDRSLPIHDFSLYKIEVLRGLSLVRPCRN